MNRRFVMVEGMDGSGKGTIVDGLKENAERKGLKTLDVRDYCKKNLKFPDRAQIKKAEVIVSCEPTYGHVGTAIREELIRHSKKKYSTWSLAHAFSLDREILYKNVVIPALELKKTVFQERGLVSSLVYQTIQDSKIRISDLLSLPGNKLAIVKQNVPSLLIIAVASPETALKRLGFREKKDNSIFDNFEKDGSEKKVQNKLANCIPDITVNYFSKEDLTFQKKLASRYDSDMVKSPFESKGSKVKRFDTDTLKPEDTKKQTVKLVEKEFARDKT